MGMRVTLIEILGTFTWLEHYGIIFIATQCDLWFGGVEIRGMPTHVRVQAEVRTDQ